MTEIDKRNLKNYLYITFGITYIAWGILAIFTQSHILGLETIIGRMLHIVGALGPAIASGLYLKTQNRGILQPLLDKKYTYWQSNLIVGLIWGIWHLPLWFIVGESHQGFPFILFFVHTLFLSFVLGLLYRQTKSVGYCILFHAFANLLNLYFVLKINVIFIIIFIAYLIYTILASNKISK